MFFHKHEVPSPLAIFRHDGYWEVRRGALVIERFVVLEDALVYRARMQVKAA